MEKGTEREKEKKFLIGLDEISDYYGRSKTVVKDLIRNDNFPAVKVHGRWESSADLIDRYRIQKISAGCKTAKENADA